MFTHDRDKLRQVFFDTWRKMKNKEIMIPLEEKISRIIELHPEYHAFLDQPENRARDFLPEMGETNPFLHLSLHISIEEQLSVDRPVGIRTAFKNVLQAIKDPHEATHACMECLAETMWSAQRENRQPDDDDYLKCLAERARRKN